MADYTLHLGFRWDGPAIGSILGASAALPQDARFLQFALADDDGAPAWFQFQPQDAVSVQVWDLSSTSASGPSGFALGLTMSFGPLGGDGGDSYTTIDPTTLVTSDDYTVTTQEYGGKPSQVLTSNAIVTSGSPGDCPWGSSRACYTAGKVTLTAGTGYELAFILTVSYQGTLQYFAADPEVIIGSHGGGTQ